MVTANELLKQPPSIIFDTIQKMTSSQNNDFEDFNWHGLAEVSAFKASRSQNKQEALEWAKVSIFSYDYLVKHSHDTDTFIHSSMMLRANMICKYGVSTENPVLDITPIYDWFDRSLTFSMEGIKEHINTPFLEQDLERLKEFRRLKNRLNILELFQKKNKAELVKKYHALLEIKDQLA